MVALGACGLGTENVLLGHVSAGLGGVSLGSGCWKNLHADAELVDGHIIVRSMTASGRITHELAPGVLNPAQIAGSSAALPLTSG